MSLLPSILETHFPLFSCEKMYSLRLLSIKTCFSSAGASLECFFSHLSTRQRLSIRNFVSSLHIIEIYKNTRTSLRAQPVADSKSSSHTSSRNQRLLKTAAPSCHKIGNWVPLERHISEKFCLQSRAKCRRKKKAQRRRSDLARLRIRRQIYVSYLRSTG